MGMCVDRSCGAQEPEPPRGGGSGPSMLTCRNWLFGLHPALARVPIQPNLRARTRQVQYGNLPRIRASLGAPEFIIETIPPTPQSSKYWLLSMPLRFPQQPLLLQHHSTAHSFHPLLRLAFSSHPPNCILHPLNIPDSTPHLKLFLCSTEVMGPWPLRFITNSGPLKNLPLPPTNAAQCISSGPTTHPKLTLILCLRLFIC